MRYPRAQGYVLTLLIDVYGRAGLRPPSTMGQQLPRRGGPSGHRASPLVRARGLPTLATPLPSRPAGALGRAPTESRRLVSQALWLEKRPLPISETQHGLWAPPASPALCPPTMGDPPEASLDLYTFHFLLVQSQLSPDHLLPALSLACSGANPDLSYPL